MSVALTTMFANGPSLCEPLNRSFNGWVGKALAMFFRRDVCLNLLEKDVSGDCVNSFKREETHKVDTLDDFSKIRTSFRVCSASRECPWPCMMLRSICSSCCREAWRSCWVRKMGCEVFTSAFGDGMIPGEAISSGIPVSSYSCT